MTGPRRPVALRPDALRALLRQPDLPPDLVAKITERAGDLTRAEQARDVAAMSGWGGLRRRLPIILGLLAALGVAAGIAFVLSPVPPVAAPGTTDVSADEASEAVVEPGLAQPVPPVPTAQPLTGAGQALSPQGGSTVQGSPAQSAAVSPAAHGRSEASSVGGRSAQTAGAAPASRVTAPASAPAARQETGAPAARAGQASPQSTTSAPSSGDVPASSGETAPAPPVSVPTVVPLVEVPAQP